MKTGAAFYKELSCKLSIFPDLVNDRDFNTLKKSIEDFNPSVLVLDPRNCSSLNIIKEWLTEMKNEIKIETIPSKYFNMNVALSMLKILELGEIPKDIPPSDKYMYIENTFGIEDNELMTIAIGALLKYLEKNKVGHELENSRLFVSHIEITHFNHILFLDENTYRSLQIFKSENHPSSGKLGASKEGLSLFGIMNRTKTRLGSTMLREWFQRPSKDIALLMERQKTLQFFTQAEYRNNVDQIRNNLRFISNIPRILTKMKKGLKISYIDWISIHESLLHFLMIQNFSNGMMHSQILILSKTVDLNTSDVPMLIGRLESTFDLEECKKTKKIVIKPGIDLELDEKQRLFNGLGDFLTLIAKEEMKEYPLIQQCTVVYFPQLGYLLSIPNNNSCVSKELEFQFSTEYATHYKTNRMKELDNDIGDIHSDIIDLENKIQLDLIQVILSNFHIIISLATIASEIDCYQALSSASLEFNYQCMPKLFKDNRLIVKEGRHPLQELCVNQFIPNDTVFYEKKEHIHIFTGPNASGKSIYLKQVGILCFMAHLGTFIPANYAEIGLIDKIFTRIHSRESISLCKSTFMIDLNQVGNAIKNSSESSLLIIDEFGKGTSHPEGLSLLISTLEYWENKSMKILLATHFYEIFGRKLLQNETIFSFKTMDIKLCEGSDPVYLFKVKEGRSNHSYANTIAKTAGISESIVERAVKINECLEKNLKIAPVYNQYRITRYENVIRAFIDFDEEKDDIKSLFTGIHNIINEN